jgi:hypothetical protein
VTHVSLLRVASFFQRVTPRSIIQICVLFACVVFSQYSSTVIAHTS